MKTFIISFVLLMVASLAYSQKFMLKLDKDMKPLLDSVAFEIKIATLKYGLMDFVIMNKQLSHSQQNVPIYIYVTGSYPRVTADTMVGCCQKLKLLKVFGCLLLATQILTTRNDRDPLLCRSRFS